MENSGKAPEISSRFRFWVDRKFSHFEFFEKTAKSSQTSSLELSDLVYCNTMIVWTPYYEVYCMNFIMMLIEKSGQFIANERRVINVKLNVINFERDSNSKAKSREAKTSKTTSSKCSNCLSTCSEWQQKYCYMLRKNSIRKNRLLGE